MSKDDKGKSAPKADSKADTSTQAGAPSPAEGSEELEATKAELAKAQELLGKQVETIQARDAELEATKAELAKARDELGNKRGAANGEVSQLRALLQQKTEAERDNQRAIQRLSDELRQAQAELASRRKAKGATELEPIDGLPKGTIRLLTSTVLMDDQGARVYAKRGDVAVPDGNERGIAAAQKVVGSKARVYAVRGDQAAELVKGGAAEQA